MMGAFKDPFIGTGPGEQKCSQGLAATELASGRCGKTLTGQTLSLQENSKSDVE